MANTTLQLKKSGTTGNVPPSLTFGELALNYADGKLYYKAANGTITYIQSGTPTDSFATINANSSLILATSPTDTLSILPGNNITISACTVSKTITLSVANTITTDALNISTNTSNVSLTKGTGITSWNYSGLCKSVTGEETAPSGLFFSPNGLNMYVNGSTGDDVNQYTLSIAWDVSTATYLQLFSTAAQDTSPNDIFFKPDGLSMYIMGATNDTVFQYTLSSAFDISTASYASKSFSVTSQETVPIGLWFKPDGTVMYIIGTTNDTVFQYNLGTAWDVSTASYASISFSVQTQDGSPTQVNLSADGLTMWILGAAGDDISQYALGAAWNVSTAVFENSFYVGFQEFSPNGLFIDSTAANRVYMVGQLSDTVYQYNTDTNSIAITTDVLTVNNNARIQGNLAVQSAAYVDGALSVGGSTSLSTTSVSGTLSATSTITLGGSTTATVSLGTTLTTGNILTGTSMTTGNIFVGGLTQTGNITLGQSNTNQTVSIANGTTAAGATKVVHLGINGASGSNTRIFIGPSAAGANGNVTFNPATTVAIQNTRVSTSTTTGALTVLGGVGVSGSIYADALYDGGVEVITYTQGVNNTQNTNITTANNAAWAAFNQANSATTLAQDAYNYANTISGGGGSLEIVNDNSSNNVYYINFTANTSGNVSTLYTSSEKLTYNPSTGTVRLNALEVTANTNISANTKVITGTSPTTLDTFSADQYRGAFYQVQMEAGGSFHVLNLSIVNSGGTAQVTPFGDAYNAGSLATFSVSISAGSLTLTITPVTGSTTVSFLRHLLVKQTIGIPTGDLGFVSEPATVFFDAGFDSEAVTSSFDYGYLS